jgi:hypothetical protein
VGSQAATGVVHVVQCPSCHKVFHPDPARSEGGVWERVAQPELGLPHRYCPTCEARLAAQMGALDPAPRAAPPTVPGRELPRASAFPWPMIIAAAVLVAVLAGGYAWHARGRGKMRAPGSAGRQAGGGTQGVEAGVPFVWPGRNGAATGPAARGKVGGPAASAAPAAPGAAPVPPASAVAGMKPAPPSGSAPGAESKPAGKEEPRPASGSPEPMAGHGGGGWTPGHAAERGSGRNGREPAGEAGGEAPQVSVGIQVPADEGTPATPAVPDEPQEPQPVEPPR